jgi:hypothetical protein
MGAPLTCMGVQWRVLPIPVARQLGSSGPIITSRRGLPASAVGNQRLHGTRAARKRRSPALRCPDQLDSTEHLYDTHCRTLTSERIRFWTRILVQAKHSRSSGTPLKGPKLGLGQFLWNCSSFSFGKASLRVKGSYEVRALRNTS